MKSPLITSAIRQMGYTKIVCSSRNRAEKVHSMNASELAFFTTKKGTVLTVVILEK